LLLYTGAMPSPSRLRWRNLALGIASGVVVLTLAVLIMVYGRVGSLRG